MKTVILSTNDNPDYLLYLPYVQKAWNNLGWNTFTFYLGKENLESSDKNQIHILQEIPSIRNVTLVQVSRLFGHHYVDGLIMTSDIDMMPLSDYWKPSEDEVTCYGTDLTNFRHHPICYIAADKEKWQKLIPEKSIEELTNKYANLKSNHFNEWWFLDQDIITERIQKNYKNKTILRNFENGLAYGRIDRVNWEATKNSKTIKIDAHMPRPFDRKEAEELLFKYHNIK